MNERINRALTIMERYAANADENAEHALTQAGRAEDVAQRLWLTECDQERVRALVWRNASGLVRAALEEGEG
jgi:N-acetylmuramic acid 6-phosphate (MurNAc-6-P) etherase